MTTRGGGGLAVLAALVSVMAILAATYVVARSPGDVLDGNLPAGATVGPRGEAVPYALKSGRNASDIGQDLQRSGVIRSGRQFELLVSLMGLQNKLSAGDFVLAKNSSPVAVVAALTVRDATAVTRVTFPEGQRVEEMADVAARAGIGTRQQFLDAVAAAVLPPELAANLPAGAGFQGYLFPDTYILPSGSTATQLVALMIKTMDRRFTPELRAAAATHGLDTHQALTLAAVVEREAAREEERPIIAAVFYNRIAAGDRLGADPTVQFAVALELKSVEKSGWWKKELTLEDLVNPSKYNTRLYAGLPPGPIACPGLASIQAVANPEKTNFYYFVADSKKADGSHAFAVTFAEHERNIALYGQ
ncbi:MAG: endolytic transglycosylase MltG [Tepidiformaceae bacterium]